ncbi:tetratricopeptide repeat protein [Haloferula sp. A504]|uniref:tetratricopeptide repeat protein n=1 Tax=Haloferula sp. A504 TaxID=3373601 RepID=UPI0031BF64F7|nr:hypothetical protein [Verrucomicrobiaceae bacterium E54]
MKLLPLLLILLTAIAPVAAQDNDKPEKRLQGWEEDFLNLPEDRRKEFAERINKARELFGQKRIFETIEELKAAEKIFADSPDVENMLGACQVEFRAFDKAMEHFDRANSLSPGNASVLFNIAEVHFVTKNWTEAERNFERVLALVEDDEKQKALYHLTEFKLMLCMIKSGKLDEARKMVGKYDFMVDTPFPFYAEAAIAYHDGDDLKAEAALARASRVFRNPQLLAPWHDTLMEFGYIKSFYGGDLIEEE